LRAGLLSGAAGQIINVGTQEETSIRRLAEIMIELGGGPSTLRFVPQATVYGESYEDVPRRVPDVSRMDRILGVRATTPLTEGLAGRSPGFAARGPGRAGYGAMSDRGNVRLALKVDVDTHDGLARGVPAIAELLASAGVRLVLRRLRSRSNGSAHRPTPRPTLRRQTAAHPRGRGLRMADPALGHPLAVAPCRSGIPDALRRLAAAGHEVAVHGYDHARWQDRLPRLSEAQVRAEVTRAASVLRGILGTDPRGFAAPGWRCTPASLAAVDAAGFAYRSDTRGSYPYLPAAAGRVFPSTRDPHQRCRRSTKCTAARRGALPSSADYYVGLLRPDALNVHTIHAELEGGPYVGVLDTLLARLRRSGLLRVACVTRPLAGHRETPDLRRPRGRVPGRRCRSRCRARNRSARMTRSDRRRPRRGGHTRTAALVVGSGAPTLAARRDPGGGDLARMRAERPGSCRD